jgi:hypothetical protein
MFQHIAADLREFVAAVQDDTKTVVNIVRQDAMGTLDQLDEALLVGLTPAAAIPLSEAEREAKFRTTIREVYSTPLPSCAGGGGADEEEEEDNEVTEADRQQSMKRTKSVDCYDATNDCARYFPTWSPSRSPMKSFGGDIIIGAMPVVSNERGMWSPVWAVQAGKPILQLH